MKKTLILGSFIVMALLVVAVIALSSCSTGEAKYAPPVPKPGSLYIASTPTGAIIYLNDGGWLYKCATPITLTNLTAKTYQISIQKTGYQAYNTSVSILAGKTTTLNAVLKIRQTPTNQTPVPTNQTPIPTNQSPVTCPVGTTYQNGACKPILQTNQTPTNTTANNTIPSTNATPECGNGVCDVPYETFENCNVDCKCKDTDGGYNIYTKGWISGLTSWGSFVDKNYESCINYVQVNGTWIATGVFEMYCSPDNRTILDANVQCPSGKCTDGACVPLPTNPSPTNTCKDSDGPSLGAEFLLGNITGIYNNSNFTNRDYCLNSATVVEWDCGSSSNPMPMNSWIACQNGCSNGACTIYCTQNNGICAPLTSMANATLNTLYTCSVNTCFICNQGYKVVNGTCKAG